METTHSKTKRRIAALGVAAAAAMTPALMFTGAGTALADDCNGGALQGSYYCSPRPDTPSPAPGLTYTPSQPPFGYNNLPQCSGGTLAALGGLISGDGCT